MVQDRLDSAIADRPLLKSSFYVRWQEGNISMRELQGYSREYYRFEREFPRFVSAIHSRIEDPEMRKDLLEHLNDEEGGEDNHPELWLRFAEALGVPREGVKEHFHSDETEHLLRVFKKHCFSENPIDGLACLFAYERQQPGVMKKKVDGLKSFYGVDSERGVEFFKVHEEVDVWHANNVGDLLSKLCKTESDTQRAEAVAKETLDALYDFLEGVERRYAA